MDTKQKEQSISPLPTLHPKAYLWKRLDEKPKDLSNYLDRFPEDVFTELCNTNTGLCDVSVSSVSSYEDSDAESFLLYVSEVEVDSDVEKAVVHSGGRVVYLNNADIEETKGGVESDFTLASDELTRSEPEIQEREETIDYQPPDAKRLRTDQPLPSSPESVQSNLTHPAHVLLYTPPPTDVQLAVEEDASKDIILPNGRRRSTA